MKKLIAFVLAGMMLVSLGGCGASEFDAQGYVQAVMDAKFHREYEAYAEVIGVTAEEAKEQMESEFNKSLEDSMAEFKSLYGATDEEMAQYIQLEADIRAKVQYEVKDAVKDEDGNFAVEVVITPIPAYTNLQNAFTEKLRTAIQSGATEDEYMASFLEAMKECMANAGTGEPVTMTLHVKWEESGKNKVYSIDEEEWLNVDLVATGQAVE